MAARNKMYYMVYERKQRYSIRTSIGKVRRAEFSKIQTRQQFVKCS